MSSWRSILPCPSTSSCRIASKAGKSQR
jgi:hypothetical protein